MIQQNSILKVADNSGAKKVKCINVLGGFKRKYAKLGDNIMVSIKELRNKSRKNSKVLKGDVYKAVILRTKKNICKKDGNILFFQNNAVCLLNKQGKPLATRLLGPLPKKLKKNSYIRLASISTGFF